MFIEILEAGCAAVSRGESTWQAFFLKYKARTDGFNVIVPATDFFTAFFGESVSLNSLEAFTISP
jgi:hypothetical protein